MGMDVLLSHIIDKNRRAFRHSQHGIPLDLCIGRQNTFREPRHYTLWKVEILPIGSAKNIYTFAMAQKLRSACLQERVRHEVG
jgi:hypothetical protein